jgi:hypothetical protein
MCVSSKYFTGVKPAKRNLKISHSFSHTGFNITHAARETYSLLLGAIWPLISRVKADQIESLGSPPSASDNFSDMCVSVLGYIAAGASLPESAAMWNKSCGSRWFSRRHDPKGVLIVVSSPSGLLSTACYEVRAVLWGAASGTELHIISDTDSNDIWSFHCDEKFM